MPHRVAAGASLDAYANIFGATAVERIREAARGLKGASILHLSLARSGTHHARMLDAAVPLLTNLGLDVHWKVPQCADEDMTWSVALHKAIEGDGAAWGPGMPDAWRRYSLRHAAAAEGGYDFVVLHDPQLLMLRSNLKRSSQRASWMWHCHFDLRDCDEHVAQLITDQLNGFDLAAVEHPAFAGAIGMPTRIVIPPVIDPLSGRNARLPPRVVDGVLRRYDLASDCPLVVEVSPFDGWDDPMWAVHAYQVARRDVPGLQLVMVATSESDEDVFRDITGPRRNGSVRLLRYGDAGDAEINALQGAAVVAMQNAVRKGFSTSLLEASWKGRPVLACDADAMSYQVVHGTTGYLFATFDDAAQRIVQLASDHNLSDALGFNGHRMVRDNHLVVRWVEAYLNLLSPAVRTVA